MKKPQLLKKILFFSIFASTASLASAQEHARVLSSTPIVQQVAVPQQVCGNEMVYSGQRTTGGGAVLGAIAGGAAGNAIGRGNGRVATTAIGVVGGALLGNRIEGNGRPEYENVRRCHTQTYYENRTAGYTVVYEYAGRQYTTQTQNDPGGWIAINVQPFDGRRNPYAVPSSTSYDQPGSVTTYPVQPAYAPRNAPIIEYNDPPPYSSSNNPPPYERNHPYYGR